MDNQQENMERLIRSFKLATPALKDPDRLTNSIMHQIGKYSSKKTPTFLIWTRAALSTAAAVFIGLFLFQQTEAENTATSANYKPIQNEKIKMDSTCMQMLGSEQLNIIKTYLCYMQQNSIENEQYTTYPQQKN